MAAKRKQAGRKQAKHRYVAIRMSEDEHAAIQKELARLEIRTGFPVALSAWIRRAIQEQLKRDQQTEG